MGNFISYGHTNCLKNRTQNQPILLGRFATLALQTIRRKKENIYFPRKKRLNLTQPDRAKAQEIRYRKVRYLASAIVISSPSFLPPPIQILLLPRVSSVLTPLCNRCLLKKFCQYPQTRKYNLPIAIFASTDDWTLPQFFFVKNAKQKLNWPNASGVVLDPKDLEIKKFCNFCSATHWMERGKSWNLRQERNIVCALLLKVSGKVKISSARFSILAFSNAKCEKPHAKLVALHSLNFNRLLFPWCA